MSADPPWTYDNIHWICSSTDDSLNLILTYNLHAPMNLETFDSIPSKVCDFATSVATNTPLPTPLFTAPPTYTVNAAICSYNCLMMAE